MKEVKCEFCNGDGAFITFNMERRKLEVQRCDACKKFKSDLIAWKSLKPK